MFFSFYFFIFFLLLLLFYISFAVSFYTSLIIRKINMKVAYANIMSLNTSYNLVETACKRQQIEILGLSEIWYPANRIKENVKRSWNWIATERAGERGGGAALMISKNVKVYERKDLYKEDVEAVWCNVYSREENFVIGSVYIPPNDSKV